MYTENTYIFTMNVNVKNLNFIACFAEKKVPKNRDLESGEFLEGPAQRFSPLCSPWEPPQPGHP